MKVTKKILEQRVEILGEVLGLKNLRLEVDYNGYTLSFPKDWRGEVIRSEPFGPTVWKARELFDQINFALRAIQIDRAGTSSGAYWPDDKNPDYLMNPHTGTVMIRRHWRDEGHTPENSELVPVERDENGDWREREEA